MKRCTGCLLEQAIEAFPLRGSERGRTSRCKTCRCRAQREYRRRHATRDEARRVARRRDPEVRRANAARHRLKKYGLTSERYDAMLIEQAGRCAICRAEMTDPHVDHCHATHGVRGLLCGSCNRAIGLLHDDPLRIQAALLYVAR